MKTFLLDWLRLSLILTIIFFFGSGKPAQAADDFSRTSIEFTKQIVAGWNLGNTLEAHDPDGKWTNEISPLEAETKWWNPVTTQAMFDQVAQAGFNAVRIPVTWYKFTRKDRSGNFVISPAYQKRVKEIVQYGLNRNLIVVVNMHHDDKVWLDLTKSGAEWDAIVEQYRQMWTIIADLFKDYGENLVLEAGNEMVAGNDWWGKESAFFDRQNELYKVFCQVVRSSGGNNAKRYLVLPTYGAQWYPYQYRKVWFPKNDSRIICDIHWYSADVNPDAYRDAFKQMADYFRSQNVGFIMGECGLQQSNAGLADEWSAAFVATARKNGIPCFLWDDGGNFQVLDRRQNAWKNDFYVRAVLEAAQGKRTAVKTAIHGDIQYQNWYCNNAASIIQSDGSANVRSGSDYVRQIQPCYRFSGDSVSALKKLAKQSKDGFVYVDFVGQFETGADQKKLFIKGGLKSGGGWDVGKDWQFTLESGDKVSVPFPVGDIMTSDELSLTIQMNNYTYGSGIRNLNVRISVPYVR